MDPIKEWWITERVKNVIEKLRNHGFEAEYLKTKEEAVKKILEQIPQSLRVGVGGSMTIRELFILEKLEEQGNTLHDHWKSGLTKETMLDIRKKQLTCDYFLSGVNAITLNGELVNIDATGNRVNASVFGPGKVILVAGYNKIVEDMQEGIKRIKNISAPLTAKRLNIDVPCAKVGKCVDCNSPNRICRAVVIHERRPTLTDILVIIVGEELGF